MASRLRATARHTLAIALAVCAMLLAGCAAGPTASAGAPGEPARPPRERLDELVQMERLTPQPARSVRNVPVPSSIDAASLAERDLDDPRAFLPLDFVLKQFQSIEQASLEGDLADEPDVPADQHAEALRLFVRGRLAAEAGNDAEAMGYFEQAAAIEPSIPALQRAIAHASLRLNRPEAVTRAYEQLVLSESRDVEALFMLGLSEANQRRFDAALPLLARAAIAAGHVPSDPAIGPLLTSVLAHSLGELGYDRAAAQAIRACLTTPVQASASSPFIQQLAELSQRRPELLRSLGDLHCRLGEYDDALEAYSAMASMISPAHPRVSGRLIYVSARLARPYRAQHVLRLILDERGDQLAIEESRFADYIAQHCPPVDALRDSVALDLPNHASDVRWVIVAAALSPAAQRDLLVQQFISDHGKSLGPAFELIRWRWSHDRLAALQLAEDLAQATPRSVPAVARWCVCTLPQSTAAIAILHRLPHTPTRVALEAHMHLAFGDPGSAWRTVQESVARFARSPEFRRAQMEVALALDEAPFVLDAIRGMEAGDQLDLQLLICSALRSIGRTEAALDHVRSIEPLDDGTNDWLIEHARCLIAHTTTQVDRSASVALAEQAGALLQRAITRHPDDERIYETQMSLYNVGGVLHDPDEYRNTFQRFVQASPDSTALTHFIMAETIRQQQFDRTVRVAQRLFNTDPTDARAPEALIEAWWRTQQEQSAVRWLELSLAEFPSHPALIEQRVRLHLLRDDASAAAAFLDATRAREPNHPAVLRNRERVLLAGGKLNEVFALAQQRINRRPPGVRRSLELATVALETEHDANAAQLLRSVADNADDAKLEYLTTAMLLAFQLDTSIGDRVPLVERLAMAAIHRFPYAPTQVYGLALFALHARVGLSAEFTDLADRTVERDLHDDDDPAEQVSSWRQIAQVFVDAGHVEAVSGLLRIRLRRAAPDQRALTSAMCVLLVALDASLSRADASLDLLREYDRIDALPAWPGIEHQPSFNELLYEVSLIHSTLDNRPGVDMLLSELLSRDPKHGMALNNLGYMLLDSPDQSARARDFIERAAQVRGDDPNVLDSLAWLRYKQGRFADDHLGEGAFTIIERALESIAEPQPEVLDHRGDIAWRLGLRDEAIASWQQVAEVLGNPAHRNAVVRSLRNLQAGVWGVVVADPQKLYDRDYGPMLAGARAKLDAAKAEQSPPVERTFAELSGE